MVMAAAAARPPPHRMVGRHLERDFPLIETGYQPVGEGVVQSGFVLAVGADDVPDDFEQSQLVTAIGALETMGA